MEFRILGPVEVLAGSQRLELGSARQQVVLGTLLLSANRPVTVERLVAAIYGEDLPPTARLQAQINIFSLRRLFTSHGRAAEARALTLLSDAHAARGDAEAAAAAAAQAAALRAKLVGDAET